MGWARASFCLGGLGLGQLVKAQLGLGPGLGLQFRIWARPGCSLARPSPGREHPLYAKDLINKVRMTDAKPFDCPIEINVKCNKNEGTLLFNYAFYRTLVGHFIYLITT